MKLSFKKIGIIGRVHNAHTVNAIKTLIRFLSQQKITVYLEKETSLHFKNPSTPIVPPEKLDQYCDLLIVIGGDGSLLHAARLIATQNLPMVGIHRGHLGFLTDIHPENMLKKIKEILAGKYTVEKRFLLEAFTENDKKKHYLALNEMVLTTQHTAKMIEFDTHVDHTWISRQRADGIMIATPTGSTAYNLSAGGPIVHPDLNALILLSMFPHTLSQRPLVINSNASIKLIMTERNRHAACLNSDGETCATVPPKGVVHIRQSKKNIRLIHPIGYDYFDALRSKLHWGSPLPLHIEK